MGEAAERNGRFRKERVAPKLPKDRSGKIKSICSGTSGRVPVGNGGDIRMQRRWHSICLAATEDNTQKKTTRYREQDREKVAAYQEQVKDIPPEKIAYVDECGIDTYLYREYGYAPRGQKVFDQISGRKYKRCGIVAAQMADRIVAPLQYSGTMDSALFEFWFTEQLLPSLEKGTVIVMDNASFHSKKRLISLAQNAGCKLIFLPPYSPELNPIENFWAWLKRFLRKILSSAAAFDDALFTAFQLW